MRRPAVLGADEGTADVAARFEELAWADTPMGQLSLRRRLEPVLQVQVVEVKLGDEYLMSSLFTVAEVALARLGLARLAAGGEHDPVLDVVVAGLGLGYTARTVLEDRRVRSVVVVDALAEVISWHEQGLLPDAAGLAADPRTRLVHADFFALARAGAGFDPQTPGARAHAVLVDVDHSPRHLLHPSHADLYTAPGLSRVAETLHPGGVFALWSDDPPDGDLLAVLTEVFTAVDAEVVTFPNPFTGAESANTVYLASTPSAPAPGAAGGRA